jgi:uncharacterized protein (TIGR00255 family)
MSASLASMTGFARATREADGLRLRVEMRSVNGRGLDLRLRMAPGLDAFEVPLRQQLSKAFSRGSISVNVALDRVGGTGAVRVNEQALATIIAALDDLSQRVTASPASLDGILALPGVLEVDDGAGALDEERLGELVLACGAETIANLAAARRQEGAAIAVVLLDQLATIEALVAKADAHPACTREHIAAQLARQLEALKQDATLSPDRLAQEALLLATRADIREELDRLRAHIVAARKLIADGGPVGRRMDFLAQEFNREANTLCSKANAVDLTAIGLDLKAVIDQLREQVQNIE